MINPAVAGHGGYVELIDVQENRVYLQMGGGCQGCGAADVTLKAGIERLIKDELPEVVEVLDTTDHAAGANPRSEEHTSELQSQSNLVCRLLLEKKKKAQDHAIHRNKQPVNVAHAVV